MEQHQAGMLQKDLKKVLQVLPEGVMIYKRFGNPHIKLWNNEMERLFAFKSLPTNLGNLENSVSENIGKNGKIVENIDDLDDGHLKDIMSQKILMPVSKLIE
jgi:hypothetical protein